jgi:hypothetical protein
MRNFMLFFLLAALAPAQIVSVGVKAGIPVTPALPHYESDYPNLLDTGRWTIGPTIELRLVYGFSVEADALYRAYRLQQNFAFAEFASAGVTFPPIFNSSRSNAKVWDFPVLLKYRFGTRSFRPFIDAGYTWSHSTSDVTSSQTCLGSADACAASNLSRYFHPLNTTSSTGTSGGPTAGVGVDFKVGKFKLSPEVRYTHFSNPTRNQTTVMIGFTY